MIGLWDLIKKRRKPLSSMKARELRKEEILLQRDQRQYGGRIRKLAKEKEKLFESGAKERSPEVRKMMAQDFELKTTEQIMLGRQLNISGKELVTVARFRMAKENTERAKKRGAHGWSIGQKDLAKIEMMIQNDAISTDVYQERLDEILQQIHEADESSAKLTSAGESVIAVWDQMDAGLIENKEAGFAEADRSVRAAQMAE